MLHQPKSLFIILFISALKCNETNYSSWFLDFARLRMSLFFEFFSSVRHRIDAWQMPNFQHYKRPLRGASIHFIKLCIVRIHVKVVIAKFQVNAVHSRGIPSRNLHRLEALQSPTFSKYIRIFPVMRKELAFLGLHCSWRKGNLWVRISLDDRKMRSRSI